MHNWHCLPDLVCRIAIHTETRRNWLIQNPKKSLKVTQNKKHGSSFSNPDHMWWLRSSPGGMESWKLSHLSQPQSLGTECKIMLGWAHFTTFLQMPSESAENSMKQESEGNGCRIDTILWEVCLAWSTFVWDFYPHLVNKKPSLISWKKLCKNTCSAVQCVRICLLVQFPHKSRPMQICFQGDWIFLLKSKAGCFLLWDIFFPP